MTDGLRKSHLRKAHQVGLSEVGLPDIYPQNLKQIILSDHSAAEAGAKNQRPVAEESQNLN